MKLNTIIKKILPKINNSYFYLSLLLLALVIVYLNYPITEAASKKPLAAHNTKAQTRHGALAAAFKEAKAQKRRDQVRKRKHRNGATRSGSESTETAREYRHQNQ